MSENSKRIIQKNPDGEYKLTPYGEFVSYFHAHLELFKRFYKLKNFSQEKLNKDLPILKQYIANNIKKVDQYFPAIPEFANIIGIPSNDLSNFLNKNFLEVLPIVQEKLIQTEIQKLGSLTHNRFERITEELLETTDYRFPENKKFVANGNYVYIEDTKTGEIIEPKGLMAIGQPHSNVAALTPQSDTPSQKPSFQPIKEKSILEEIVEVFGSELQGVKLDVKNELEESNIFESEKESTATGDDLLEDIGDLNLEMEEPITQSEEESVHNVLSGIEDILDDIESNQNLIISKEAENYSFKEFIQILKDTSQSPSASSQQFPNYIQAILEIRKLHIQEMKSQTILWEKELKNISNTTGLNQPTIQELYKKTIMFNWIRYYLDRALSEFKKGTPEFIGIVQKAWPFILEAFSLAPDFNAITERLKNIVSKISNPDYRKEVVRVLSMVLNSCKSKL